ncbi:MAG: LuxR C-terminal-related transcriptional regulator, partial [Acidimicrobiia bacterium]
LLASGRIETMEKWLARCGSAGFLDPGAVLARAEIAVRRGRFSEAASLARDLADRLPPDDPNLARTWNTIGQAHILQSNYADALDCHLEARKLASKEGDLTQALWGAFLSASELEFDAADDLLSEFQELVPRDATGQLRLGSGKQIAATHSGSFAGVWPSLEPLMSLATTEADPMAASNFLANAAYVNVGRGDYQLAKSLAERGVKFCTDLRLDFATAFCLVQLAAADIGLRDLRSAERTVAELSRTGVRHEDPWLRATMRTLEIRLALAKGQVEPAASLSNPALDPATPPAPRGEYLGVSAIALAASGQFQEARERAREALSATHTIEAVYYSRYGLLIADISQLTSTSAIDHAGRRIIHDSQAADFLDALVVSYRASPKLLNWLADQTGIEETLIRAMAAANDEHIARRIGLELRQTASEPSELAHLTPREHEVLEHLAKGFSNEEIAKHLFISRSTTKVHVHHILGKLGVRTRLQAVLRAQELLRASD